MGRENLESPSVEAKEANLSLSTEFSDISSEAKENPVAEKEQATEPKTETEEEPIILAKNKSTAQPKALQAKKAKQVLSQNKPLAPAVPTEKTANVAKSQSPSSSTVKDNPNFQAFKKQVEQAAKQQGSHQSANHASEQAQASAKSPKNEQMSQAQAGQVRSMDKQEPKEFDKNSFREQLKARIAGMELPENEEKAANFSENNNLDQINKEAVSDVKAEKNTATSPIETASKASPDLNSVAKREAKNLPKPNIGKKPAIQKVAEVMPEARETTQVEGVIQSENESIDLAMAEQGISDSMLANSNEASFLNALDQKNTAKEQSEASLSEFRNQEEVLNAEAQADAQQTSDSQSDSMFSSRKSSLNKSTAEQNKTALENTAKRKEIANKVDGLYLATQNKVKTLLSTLETEVADKFSTAASLAQQAFEDHIAQKMEAYKKERYGESWYDVKQLRRVKDAVVGLPEEVNEFFVSGREIYIKTMEGQIDAMADLVSSRLKEAKNTISEGKKQIQTYVGSLSPELQKIGQKSITAIQGKFEALEASVDEKKNNLIDTIAEKYAENVSKIDEKINQLKQKNKGLLQQAMNSLSTVFEFILATKKNLDRTTRWSHSRNRSHHFRPDRILI